MTFLTFLLYFIGASLIYDFFLFLILTSVKFFIARKRDKTNKFNEGSIISLEELVEKINKAKNKENEEGEGEDGTWH